MTKRKRLKCYLGLHYWWEYRSGCFVCESCRKQKGRKAKK